MATTKTSPKKKKKRKVKPKACPTCGSIECFERSRYFPGQLLTNKDLEADQRYFIEKNKLHNRYLVGNGVVCGLAVRCHPSCNGVVVVESGYAIDCCGNDIVLCDQAEFDLMEYLEACRREEDPDCYGKIRPRPSRCNEEPKEYCLILSYAEEPAKPVTALIRDNGCKTSRCEPSRICETFRFDLIEKNQIEDQPSPPNFWDKIQECFTSLSERFVSFAAELQQATQSFQETQNLGAYHETVFGIFCRMKTYIIELYKTQPKLRCTLLEELHEIEASFPALPTPVPSDTTTWNEYLQQVQVAVFRMASLILQFWIDCFCDALLVPCSECEEEGVLLACLTLCGGKIEKICNIVRKPVLTGPALQYWLQPFYNAWGDFLETLCCDFEFRVPDPRQDFNTVGVAFNRSGALVDIVRSNVLTNPVINLRDFTISQLTNSETLAATDVYNRPLEEVRSKLKARNISLAVERRAPTAAEAYSLGNLTRISWGAIPSGSRVEVITSPEGMVTLIRVLEEGEGQDNEQ